MLDVGTQFQKRVMLVRMTENHFLQYIDSFVDSTLGTVLNALRYRPARDAWKHSRLHPDFVEQLLQEMKHKRLTRADLAARMGVSQSRFSRLINKRSLLAMERLAYALDCSLSVEIIPTSKTINNALGRRQFTPVPSFTQEFGFEATAENGSAEERELRGKWEEGKVRAENRARAEREEREGTKAGRAARVRVGRFKKGER